MALCALVGWGEELFAWSFLLFFNQVIGEWFVVEGPISPK